MKRFLVLAMVCVSLGIFSSVALAQSGESSVRSVVNAYQAAYRSCNGEAVAALLHPDGDWFPPNQGALTSYEPQGVQEGVSEFCSNGGKYDFTLEIIDVDLIGSTAIAKVYNKGSLIPPNGEKQIINDRITMVIKEEGGEWLLVHTHVSPRTE